jgi:hypothetical protein
LGAHDDGFGDVVQSDIRLSVVYDCSIWEFDEFGVARVVDGYYDKAVAGDVLGDDGVE